LSRLIGGAGYAARAAAIAETVRVEDGAEAAAAAISHVASSEARSLAS
jgi:hypothetical protein